MRAHPSYPPHFLSVEAFILSSYQAPLSLIAHSLEIEVGRYSNVHRENRLCKYYLNVVESEYHFSLTCPKYYDLRKKYIRNISWPSLSKFSYLLSSKKRTHIVNISKFINEAFRIRKINLLL